MSDQDDDEYPYTDECAKAWLEDPDKTQPYSKALADYVYSVEGDYPDRELAEIAIDFDNRRRSERKARGAAEDTAARQADQIIKQAEQIAKLEAKLATYKAVVGENLALGL